MVYQFIKEMSDATAAEEVIIVVSSLLKDINHDDDLYRGNSIRVLSKILVDVLLTIYSSLDISAKLIDI